jgi:CheY-like chemotaxis protein
MADQPHIKQTIFIDDDLDFLKLVKHWQNNVGLDGYVTSNIERALYWVKKGVADILICDLKMPYQNGMSVIQQVKKIDPNIELVILTEYNLTDEEKNIVTELGGKVCLKSNLGDLLNSLVSNTITEESSILIHLQEKISKLARLNRELMNTKTVGSKIYYLNASDVENMFVRVLNEKLNTIIKSQNKPLSGLQESFLGSFNLTLSVILAIAALLATARVVDGNINRIGVFLGVLFFSLLFFGLIKWGFFKWHKKDNRKEEDIEFSFSAIEKKEEDKSLNNRKK